MNSEDAASANHSLWTNNVSEGLQLNPGDRISVEAAFINEIGSGAQTIEFSDDIIETDVRENQLTITMEYYKIADAECCFILPRLYCPLVGGSDYPGLPANVATHFGTKYRRDYDGKRYTIYNQTTHATKNDGDIAFYSEFERLTQNLQMTIDTGYNTASDICSQLTETLHKTDSITTETNSISVSSSTFKPVQCANLHTFSNDMYTDWIGSPPADGSDYSKAFQTIGVFDPELFDAGRQVTTYGNPYGTVVSYTDPTLTVSNPHWTETSLKALFDAQANRDDLITDTSNTRFLHINPSVISGDDDFLLGSDTDISNASVVLFVEYDGSFPRDASGNWVFTHKGAPSVSIAPNQALGWDRHFSAYGNDCIIMFTGYGEGVNPGYGNAREGLYQSPYVDQAYIGAINPAVTFDSGSSRFQIQQLHTPRKQRNTLFAGKELIVSQPDANGKHVPDKDLGSKPINPDAGEDIYEINPIINKNTMQTLMTFIPEAQPIESSDSLIDKFQIIDAMTGVYITDFGVSQGNWSKSIWGKLGFSYEQLHMTGINRQGRNTNTAIVSNPVTTNADVNSTQAMNWAVNINGVPQDTLQLPQNTDKSVVSISVKATSTNIRAADLAQQQEDGYWTIRSSLIDNSLYMSHSGLAPVIAVVDKSYSSSDFIYLGDSSTDFMITKQATVTDITTSLHLPSGKLARTDAKSAVIYKVVKPNAIPTSIIDAFLPQKKT